MCFLAPQVPVNCIHGSSVHGLLAGGEVIMCLRIVDWDHLVPFSAKDKGLCGLYPGLDGLAPSGSMDYTSGSTDYTCYTSIDYM